jgi:secondary thiamine-phosphate synthase enzyme
MTQIGWYKDTLVFHTHRKGMLFITGEVQTHVENWGIEEGMCFLFIPHASASLAINENYDPSAQADMEGFLDRLAPENQAWYEHTLEGADDSPAHLRSLLTQTNLIIPIDDGRLSLGTWQGIYLIEHRRHGQTRQVLLRCWKYQ